MWVAVIRRAVHIIGLIQFTARELRGHWMIMAHRLDQPRLCDNTGGGHRRKPIELNQQLRVVPDDATQVDQLPVKRQARLDAFPQLDGGDPEQCRRIDPRHGVLGRLLFRGECAQRRPDGSDFAAGGGDPCIDGPDGLTGRDSLGLQVARLVDGGRIRATAFLASLC